MSQRFNDEINFMASEEFEELSTRISEGIYRFFPNSRVYISFEKTYEIRINFRMFYRGMMIGSEMRMWVLRDRKPEEEAEFYISEMVMHIYKEITKVNREMESGKKNES